MGKRLRGHKINTKRIIEIAAVVAALAIVFFGWRVPFHRSESVQAAPAPAVMDFLAQYQKPARLKSVLEVRRRYFNLAFSPANQSSAGGNGVVGGLGSFGAVPPPGPGTTIQVNGTNTTSQSPINFINSTPFQGLTAGFSNPSAGNIQLVLSGSLTAIGGVTVTGTPVIGQAPVATSATTATWQAPTIPAPGVNNQVTYNNLGILSGAPNLQYSPSTNNTSVGSALVSGNWQYACGPLPTLIPNSVGLGAPRVCPSGGAVHLLPPNGGAGLLQGVSSAAVPPTNGVYVSYGLSGDVNHSIPRQLYTQSIPLTVVCSLSYCQNGSFELIVNAISAATCSNSVGASVQFFVTYTDETGTQITEPITLNSNGTFISTSMALGDMVTKAAGSWSFKNVSASNIQISSSMTPCPTGNAAYYADFEVPQTQ